jgi:PKD repeat protein
MKKIIPLFIFIFGLLIMQHEVNACKVSFTFQRENLPIPMIYQPVPGGSYLFFAQDDSLATSWHWDFGDTTYSEERNPTHAYKSNGAFIVTLKASFANCTAIFMDTVFIPAKNYCMANFSYRQAETYVDCKCAGFYAFQDLSFSEVISITWDFGDSATSTEQNPVHAYKVKGAYKVSLTITTKYGCTSTIVKDLYAGIPDCNLIITSSGTGPYTFKVENGEMYDSSTISQSAYAYLWSFGDGDTSFVPSPVHFFKHSGTYNVCVKVIKPDVEVGVCNVCTSGYFNGSVSPTDSCNREGTYLKSYFDCNVPVIKTDNEVLVVTGGIPVDFANGTKLFFGYTFDPSMRPNLICGNIATQNIWLTCARVINDSIPDTTCNKTGTYWGHYFDCQYPIIKVDDGSTLLVLDSVKREILEGAHIRFGGIYNYDKILRTSCINYTYAIYLSCVKIIDTVSTCNLEGTVLDYTGLGGCGFVIKLDDGTLLEPAQVDQAFQFRDNQRIAFSYIELQGLMSACMVGKIVEITCIREIFDQPPAACLFFINLTTSTTIGSTGCTGTASAYAYSPINSWRKEKCGFLKKCVMPLVRYKFLWSTGDTSQSITNLCPNQLYTLKVTDPEHGCSINTAFSIFETAILNTAWNIQQVDSLYYFNLPVSTGYNVTWAFDDGTVKNGFAFSLNLDKQTQHNVTLTVSDLSGNQIYSEVIPLSAITPTQEVKEPGFNLLVFPVPAKNDLNLKFFSSSNQEAEIELVNMFGKVVYTTTTIAISGENFKTISVAALPNGVYVGTIRFNNTIKQFKFTK